MLTRLIGVLGLLVVMAFERGVDLDTQIAEEIHDPGLVRRPGPPRGARPSTPESCPKMDLFRWLLGSWFRWRLPGGADKGDGIIGLSLPWIVQFDILIRCPKFQNG